MRCHQRVKFITIIIIGFLKIGFVACSSPVPPEFYKPGSGAFIETWTSGNYINLENVDVSPFNEDCPMYADNLASLDYSKIYEGYHTSNIARAYFISPQKGNHKFFAVADDKLWLDIEHPLHGLTNILKINHAIGYDWSYRRWATEIHLEKGYRYLIRVRHYGNGAGTDFFRIGVKLPDSSEFKPIDTNHLLRTMEFYKWNGILGHKYNGIAFPSSGKIEDFYTTNAAKFPASPTYSFCQPTLYQETDKVDDNYAMMFFGYLRFLKNDSYTLELDANQAADVWVTKENQVVKGTDYRAGSLTNMSAGMFYTNKYYPVKVVLIENTRSDFVRLRYKATGDSFSKSWDGLLTNLSPADVNAYLPLPRLEAQNATAIAITFTETPYLPPKDNWTFGDAYILSIYKSSDAVASATIRVFEFSGAIPTTYYVNGLEIYTSYTVNSTYVGKLNGVTEFNIGAGSDRIKTGEGVPEAAPGGVQVLQINSTSWLVKWNHVSDENILIGIRAGYEIKYAIKNTSPKTWTSQIVGKDDDLWTATSLEEYTEYEVKVAARTSKGSGVFSSPKTVRTDEDKPSAPPANISGYNTSSESIFVQWDDVPFWDQNGVITTYEVRYKKVDGSSKWGTVEKNAPSKSLTIQRLKQWEFYDIKVTASTEKGEGPSSEAIRIRTDEDTPGAAPSSVSATAISSSSINVTWNEIESSKTYGTIIEYKVQYKRNDGQGSEREILSQEKTVLITGLDSYIEYDIKVAGSTIKGYGPFSNETERTLQRQPTAPPTDVKGRNLSSTAMKINWNEIPTEHRNGIITAYVVKYRQSKTAIKEAGKWNNFTVESPTLTTDIIDLEYFTFYDVIIAGVNSGGVGNYSETVKLQTDADAPGKPPMNLTGHFINHTAIVMSWFRVPKPFRFGIIRGYKLRFSDKTSLKQSWTELTIPNRFDEDDSFNMTIGNLKIYTPYVFTIAAFTNKAVGIYSENLTVWTDEYIPEKSPRNLTAHNASSTDLIIDWEKMDEIHDDANGEVLGYIIKYSVIDCHEDRPSGCDEKEVFNATSYGTNGTLTLSNLRKYTRYEIQIQVFNSKGKGNFSKTINATTDEDKPDVSPSIPESWPAKYDAINVFWSPIPESLRNGIILGYRIFYKPIDIPLRKYDRAPRAIDPLAIYGALPGEKMKEVNSTTYETELTDLKDYSWYSIRIGAFTSKGLGVTVTFNGTCKQGTPVAAPILTITDKYNYHEITLDWTEVSRSESNGEVLGYRIYYWLSELNYDPVLLSDVIEIDVYAPNKSIVLYNLQPFATYAVQISAATEAGFGVKSKILYGDTCNCPKILSSAWMNLNPLVNGSIDNRGILSQIVEEAIVSCCGDCTRGHGTSKIDWSKDKLNVSSLKYSPEDLIQSANDGTQLVLPIFEVTQSVVENLYGSLMYVPVVPVTKMLVFRKEISDKILGNAASSAISDAIFEQYPLYLISLVITVVAGILFWIFESGVNKDEFSDNYFRGCGSGIWLAYITMTTVGYGDVTPVTRMGRIHAIIWMLIGLVLMTLIVGNISSIMSMDFVFRPISIEAKEKVLVSEDAMMLAARFYGSKISIANTSNGNLISTKLLNGNASRLLIDTFKAGAIRYEIDRPQISLEEVKEVQASYGIILSGELKRASKCIKKYIDENSDEFMKKLGDATFSSETGPKSKNELLGHMMSPNSDIMEGLTQYGGALLGLLVVLGIIFELVTFCRGRSKIKPLPNDVDVLFTVANEMVDKLLDKIAREVTDIETRHVKERVLKSKMQIGKYERLLKMYPDLPLFDPDIPDLTQRRGQNPAAIYKPDISMDQNDNDEEDGEIYYKRSQIDLKI